jgi:hypothetical protein
MKTMALLGGIAAVVVFRVARRGGAPQVPGPTGRGPTGWIEFGHEKYYEIGAGTEIPSWGHVVEVRDDRIVVEQVRTEAEKRAWRNAAPWSMTCSRSISCARICGSCRSTHYLSGNRSEDLVL